MKNFSYDPDVDSGESRKYTRLDHTVPILRVANLRSPALHLETLAENERYEFAFIAAPLKLTGGTGAPIRPLAAAL